MRKCKFSFLHFLGQGEAKLVEIYCRPNFDTTFTLREQPAGLCSNCRLNLFACKRGDNFDEIGRPNPRIRWDAFEMEHARFKESEHDPTTCQVCLLAKWNPVGEKERNADKRYIMKSIIEPVPAEKSYKFCPKCYQHIGRGIPHPCTPASAKANLANIVAQLPENSQGQVVSACVKTHVISERELDGERVLVFCEQCTEAAHAVMKPTMQRFKRRSDHRHHGSKFLRAATDFTAKNMTLD